MNEYRTWAGKIIRLEKALDRAIFGEIFDREQARTLSAELDAARKLEPAH